MAITFGSVGDIITLVLLIKDLVKALDDCHGSTHSFQRLANQLRSLEKAFLEVEVLTRKHEASPHFNALCIAVQQAANACRSSAEPFLARVREHQKYLKPGGSGNVFKDAACKVKWRLLRNDEVDKFYADIAAHCHSLQILQIDFCIAMVDCHGTKTQENSAAANALARAFHKEQGGLLSKVVTRLNGLVSMSEDTRRLTQQVLALCRIDRLQAFGSKLIVMMTSVQAATFQTYTSVLSINAKMSWLRSEVLLMDAPLLLTDPLGRRMPIHLQFITSWKAFYAVLGVRYSFPQIRFRNLPGHRKVIAREFELQDDKTSEDVQRVRPWDGAVASGQRLNMDIIFKRAERSFDCPGCHNKPQRRIVHDDDATNSW
ncbi:MAG: hypothetical protein Q9159_000473 [Coniocarpon cinnabarinum]